MENERIRILRMIQEGKLTAEEGAELLEAMDLDGEGEEEPAREREYASQSEDKASVLRVEISNRYSGEIIRELKFPLGIVKRLTGIIPPSFIGKIEVDLPNGLNIQEIIRNIDNPYPSVVYEEDDGDQHVRIFTE